MAVFLEVIVNSVADAIEAEAGGADRLELVTGLHHGGLTPDFQTVENVLHAIKIPVRVMVRRNPSMSVKDASELERLREDARRLSQLPINGLVTGFLKGHRIDETALDEVMAAAQGIPITFHRAFDEAASLEDALESLKRRPQVDRVLTHGSAGCWEDGFRSALQLQKMAAPKLKILFAAGLDVARFAERREELGGLEIHVGRAVRIPQDVSGHVSRNKISELRRLFE
jgi:copper homeostasis protein